MGSQPGEGKGSAVADLATKIAAALREGAFDPQHAGEVFLRADAEKAVRGSLGAGAQIAVAGKDEGQVRPVGFMGARYVPDLVVDAAPGQTIAVTVTLIRNDAGPVTHSLAGALVLSSRYAAVVAFILDRRLAKRNPFDDPSEAPAQRALSDAEKAMIDRLWERHRVRVEVRRQDPFGW